MTRKYSSTSVATTLSTSLSSSATSMSVTAGTGAALMGGESLAVGNVDQFALVIDPDTVNEEVVFATQVSTDTFVIVRGRAGTSAVTHSNGATVKHVLTGEDLTHFNAGIINDTVTTKGDLVVGTGSGTFTRLGVGTNGYVLTADSTQTSGTKWAAAPTGDVTLSGVQTLTNKTIDYNSNTITNLPGASLDLTINAQTGTAYTLVLTDKNKLVTLNNASAITLTLPPSGTAAFTAGMQIHIQQIGLGSVTLSAGAGVTITSSGAIVAAPKLRAQYSSATIICNGTSSFTVVGDIV